LNCNFHISVWKTIKKNLMKWTVSDSYGIYSVVYGQVGAVTLRFGRAAIYRVFYLSRLLFYVVPILLCLSFILESIRVFWQSIVVCLNICLRLGIFECCIMGAQRQDEVRQNIVQIKTPVTLERMPG